MRTLRLIGIAIVAVLIGMNLTACSDDDDDNKSSTNTTSNKINGHEYEDLGLSVKWATCNIGASSSSDYGNYYAWGETETKSDYSSSNNVTYGKEMGDIAGNPEYDAATAHWGSSWRLPTYGEITELRSKCKWSWATQGGHNGYKITGPNGNSIFLPAAGFYEGASLNSVGEGGYYWSATPHEGYTDGAYGLYFNSGNSNGDWYYRHYGRSIRPVSE